MKDFTIIIDSREKRPFLIDKEGDPNFENMSVTWGYLPTGDYSIVGMHEPECSHSITIERKSLADLFQSAGKNRDRFEREFERMSKFDHASLVIEQDYRAFFFDPPQLSHMSPKSVFRTLLAWGQRYNIHIFPSPNRSFAEKYTYLALKRFWDDRQ